MRIRPKLMRVPALVVAEMEDIKREDNLISHSEAWRQMAKYTQVGREAKRLYTFDWSKSRRKK